MNATNDQLTPADEPGGETLSATPDDALVALAGHAVALAARRDGRVLFGIAGGPGSGKSTLAAQLVELLNATVPSSAALVPMDGFHLSHAHLVEQGTVAEKGAPHTFDGAGFVALLETLKTAKSAVGLPAYSREIEDVVPDAASIASNVPILVVEGNYLLLERDPWKRVRDLLDYAVFLELEWNVVRARLLTRHDEHGRFTTERNVSHVDGIDRANFELVRTGRGRADLVVSLVSES